MRHLTLISVKKLSFFKEELILLTMIIQHKIKIVILFTDLTLTLEKIL